MNKCSEICNGLNASTNVSSDSINKIHLLTNTIGAFTTKVFDRLTQVLSNWLKPIAKHAKLVGKCTKYLNNRSINVNIKPD